MKNLHYRVVETTRLHSRGSVVARKTSANGHPIDRLVSRSSLWLGRWGEALGNKFRRIRKWLMTLSGFLRRHVHFLEIRFSDCLLLQFVMLLYLSIYINKNRNKEDRTAGLKICLADYD